MKKILPISIVIFLFAPSIVWSQIIHGMGAIPTPPELARKYLMVKTEVLAGITQLPSSIDLSDGLPPVGNQGTQGSCTAWATAYYYKSFQERKEHGWNFSDDSRIASPAFVYNQIVSIEPKWIFGTRDDGSCFFDAFLLLTREGCDNLRDMPYNENDYSILPTKEQLKNAINWRADSFSFFFHENN